MFKRWMVVGAVASALMLAGCQDRNREPGYGNPTGQTQGTGGAGQGTGDTNSSGSIESNSQPGATQGAGEGSSGTQDDLVDPAPVPPPSDVERGTGDRK